MDVKSLLILKCFCLLILYYNPIVEGDIPYGVCANPECSAPIGKGVTLLSYASPDDNRISFVPNEEVEIFVKDYGPKKDLWGVTVRGHRGYISKKFIREKKSFVKQLVPAHVEFKTSVLVTTDFTVTSHVHVSSNHHHPNSLLSNTAPESVVHTQTLQDLNTIPSSHQYMYNSPNEQLQSSHLSPNFGASNNEFDLNSQFDQSSLLNSLPEHSSHYQSVSGNKYASPPVTNMQSENISPSESYKLGVIDSRQLYQDNSMPYPPFHESGLGNVPNFDPQNTLDFSQSGMLNPNYVNPSHTHQSFNEHPSSIQQQSQHFQSQNPPEMHSSLDYFDPMSEEEISKTLAMLNDRGIDDNYMYSNSYSQTPDHHSSQIIKSGFHGSETGFREMPSSSQYSSIQNNDALYSSINPVPSINFDSNTLNSDILKENIKEAPQHAGIKNDIITDKISALLNEDNAEVSNSEIVDESDDFDFDDDEGEEEEAVVEVEGTSLVDDGMSSSKFVENSDSEFLLRSSMSSTIGNEMNSKVFEDGQNSKENLVVSSVDILQKEDTEKKEKTSTSSNDPIATSFESVQLKSEVSEDSDTMHTVTVQISSDRKGEFSNSVNFTKTEFENTPHVIAKEVYPNLDKKPTDFDTVLDKKEVPDKPVIKEGIISGNAEINNDASRSGNIPDEQEHNTPSVHEFFTKEDQDSELNKILSSVNIDSVSDTVGSTYQIRNLKGEHMPNEDQQAESEGGNDENNTDSEDYNTFENGLNALKSFVDCIMSWIPEPLYSVLMDLQNKGISPRVPVFTVIWGIICVLVVVPLFFIKERSKESRLSAQLACIEKKAYTLSAANTVLEEKLESVQSELKCLQSTLEEEKNIAENLKSEFENQADDLESAKAELESYLEELDSLKEKENEYLSVLNNNEKEKENLLEHKSSLDKIITDQENSITSLTDQLQESENNVKELEKEKLHYLQMKEDYEEKITQFEQNCNQLLQEAEVWNLRVNELTTKLNEESTLKEELETTLKEKSEEIESLQQLVETFSSFEDIEDPELKSKTKEEKLQTLIDSSTILNQLKKEEEKSKVLEEQLGKEKNRILDMEVELLDAKSEIDKLKLSYNQALQDKAEAQTKLDVLTNYFKDKEIQLQKQLGAQEAVRQKTEEDATSAERRICLIEQENASYKYQVASMKQEMEETERNLKSQIAVQEKKAHENWIAARAAERKLEDMKQEVTQLRQRLTLLEREQENWANSSRDDIIRPVPKRIPGVNEDSSNQDMNTSERRMFPPPLHDRLPPVPHMMLPPDRPLPPLPPLPLPPPPMPPMFLPHMEQHYRHQPWHMRPDHSSDYRTTPEFVGGRESTPPRGRQSAIIDGETGPNTSSPLTTDARDSQNSTPPHLLPDFHDVPPQPGRPFFPPPPLHHPRLPMHPPYRRDPIPKRLDNSNEYNSRGSQQPPPQEQQWQHSRV